MKTPLQLTLAALALLTLSDVGLQAQQDDQSTTRRPAQARSQRTTRTAPAQRPTRQDHGAAQEAQRAERLRAAAQEAQQAERLRAAAQEAQQAERLRAAALEAQRAERLRAAAQEAQRAERLRSAAQATAEADTTSARRRLSLVHDLLHEEGKHRDRMARLGRLRELLDRHGDAARRAELERLVALERARHERAVAPRADAEFETARGRVSRLLREADASPRRLRPGRGNR